MLITCSHVLFLPLSPPTTIRHTNSSAWCQAQKLGCINSPFSSDWLSSNFPLKSSLLPKLASLFSLIFLMHTIVCVIIFNVYSQSFNCIFPTLGFNLLRAEIILNATERAKDLRASRILYPNKGKWDKREVVQLIFTDLCYLWKVKIENINRVLRKSI